MATTSSENVLLQMAEVRYKKNDGILYVMNERLVWMKKNRDTLTVAVSHRFQDIKMQKISPDGKPKIQLQVVLHDGNSSIFHFVNRNGQLAQITDRDKVKLLLQQLLPNFKRKFNKELEEKNRILSENPNLLQLYKDLVITQVLTSEEFWTTHVKTYMLKKKNATKKQEIGVSGAFLADIKPQTDGYNGLKYNLTADIIHCIFKTYPSVKLKYNEYVPRKLNESEFWMKFFQSHYYHRDRITTSTTTGIKDIFTECGKIDDLTIKLAAIQQQGSNNPLYDLKQFEDTNLDDDFGSNNIDKNGAINSGNIVHQNIIKRFNQHSIMVLKTSTEITKSLSSSLSSVSSSASSSSSSSSSGSTSTSSPTTSSSSSTSLEIQTTKNASSKDSNKSYINLNVDIKKKHKIINDNNNNGHSTPSSSIIIKRNEMSSPYKAKRQKIVEKIYYDDLGQPKVDYDDYNNETDLMTMPQNYQLQYLNLDKIERYLNGPVPVNNNEINDNIDDEQSRHELEMIQSQILNDSVESWGQRIPHKILVNATSAANALGELTPGGTLMRGFQKQSLDEQLVPSDVEKELRNLYLSLSELLWHFWHSFPPTTPDLEVRAVHMYEALQRFKMAKLIPFEDRSMRELSSPLGGASLTQHLNQMLQSAARKFGIWQERKMRQHRLTDENLV